MKNIFWLPGMCLLFLSACKKEAPSITVIKNTEQDLSQNYILYTITKGSQYCDKNFYTPVGYAELKFNVKFDSSAIYVTQNPANQIDINKLYGFSDNNADHHSFSARFGWRWNNNALRLFGYIYNDGIRSFKELGVVNIGEENYCSIKIKDSIYIFNLNNKADTLPRKSTTQNAIGYRLYPYFGGDETAPHNINIRIKELP